MMRFGVLQNTMQSYNHTLCCLAPTTMTQNAKQCTICSDVERRKWNRGAEGFNGC